MGMFEKDKEFGLRLDQSFDLGEPFIVWGAHISDKKMDTKVGDGTIAVIVASEMNDPGERLEYNTIASAIVEKVKLAEESDFPAVCELRRVKGRFRDDALVLQFIKEYQ